MGVVREVRYDAAYTFQYSPRPSTAAAAMDGHLGKEIVQERFDRLVDAQREISLQRNVEVVGRSEEVIVEGPSKKDPGLVTGRTRSNKLVHFEDDGAEEGSIRSVTIAEAHPHHLMGHVGEGRRMSPRRRMSLPLAAGPSCC
jgi:tRNA-2-methylthio-N6-dimethylallyladenosine synthase